MSDLVEKIKAYCGTNEDVNGCEYVELFIGTGELNEVVNIILDEAINVIEEIDTPFILEDERIIKKRNAIAAIRSIKLPEL